MDKIINNVEFARKQQIFHDTIPVFKFSRLQTMCEDNQAQLDCRVAGLVMSDGKPALHLVINGVLKLVCQRCLQPFDFGLSIDRTFVITSDNAAEDDEEWADVDEVESDPAMSVYHFIEDELILSVPFAPMHEAEACAGQKQGADTAPQPAKPNPFSVLEKLKSK